MNTLNIHAVGKDDADLDALRRGHQPHRKSIEASVPAGRVASPPPHRPTACAAERESVPARVVSLLVLRRDAQVVGCDKVPSQRARNASGVWLR